MLPISRDRPTFGLEEELFVVSCETGMPVSVPASCHAEFKRRLGARYSGEYKECVVELITRPHIDPWQVIDEAAGNRCCADGILDPYGLRTLPLASHPAAKAFDLPARKHHLSIEESNRYRRIEDFKGDAVHALAVNGVHLHVGTFEADEQHKVLPILMQLAPLHAGLTACSPYFNSRDTGQESWRLRVLMALSSTLPILDGSAEELQELERLLAQAGGPADASEHWGLVRRGAGKPTVELRAADTSPDLDILIGLVALTASAAFAVRKGWLKTPTCSESRCHSVYQLNFETAAAKGTNAAFIDVFDSDVKPLPYFVAAWIRRCERAIDALNLGDAVATLVPNTPLIHPGHHLRSLMRGATVAGKAPESPSMAVTELGCRNALRWAWQRSEKSPSRPWTTRLRAAA